VELDQRVKALEYEMKILKNEVQRTLLDIQEQVLIHYYPALRADDSAPSEGTMQSLESIRERRASIGGTTASAEAPTPPRVKQVSLEEIRALERDNSASPGPAEEADEISILQLSGWVSGSAKRIGGQRTAKLIETCVDKGWIAVDSMNVLLRLASMGSDDGIPETVAVNEILGALLKLSQLLGRGSDVEEALTLIEEANLG
jgi:hypothetical protein